MFSSPRQCLPNCRNWVCKTDAASAAPYPPAQRKESLLSSLKLACWPCFSSLPFSVSTKFPARIFRPSELVYAVCNKCCWNQSAELGRDCGVVAELFGFFFSPLHMKQSAKYEPLTLLWKSKHSLQDIFLPVIDAEFSCLCAMRPALKGRQGSGISGLTSSFQQRNILTQTQGWTWTLITLMHPTLIRLTIFHINFISTVEIEER